MANQASFLGTGWSFPPSFSEGGDEVRMAIGEEDIKESLAILLTTRRGERIMNESYGCDLFEYQFEPTDRALFNGLEALIRSALRLHEPRLEVEQVDVSESDTLAGKLLITIEYRIRTTNSRHNLVFPFYINEAIQAPDQS